tara:strand:- start:879 stop:2090 length:1212 start_codon:yes stop_codon:yes gene_type:complete
MQKISNNISLRLLLIGFFFTPFTSLRIGPIGPGEMLILLSLFFALLGSKGLILIDKRIQVITNFWCLFIFIALSGFFYNHLFLGSASGHFSSAIFDLSSYLFVLLSVLITGHLMRFNEIDESKFFYNLFKSWAVAYSILYIISFFTPTIFGLPLATNEGKNFSPLVDNIHQASSLTCAMVFVMIYMGTLVEDNKRKFFYIISAILFAPMAVTSGSSKALFGIIFGAIIGVTTYLFFKQSGKYKVLINFISSLVLISFLLGVFAVYFNIITSAGIELFQDADPRNSRQTLYWSSIQHGLESFLIGYGPGSHTPFRQDFWDAHNTILTVFLQSGILGVLVLIYFGLRLFGKLSNHYAIVGAFGAVSIYVLGGDVLRRLPIWILLLGLVYFSSAINSKQKLKKIHK